MLSQTVGLAVKLEASLKVHVRQFYGDTIGDIPLYSLHRIRSLMARQPIAISPDLRLLLVEALSEANSEYKADSGNDWNCLTSNNLVSAIESVDDTLKESVEGINLPSEQAELKGKLVEKLNEVREQSVLLIQKWFETHYDILLYDMKGNVPWSVVRRLRRDLGFWIATKGNRFGDNIEEAILDIASEEGIQTDNPEIAWEKMGGKVFKHES